MSSKLGLLISLLFFALFFFLGIDLICIQYSYNSLDSKSISIGYEIAHSLEIDNEFISSLEDKYKVKISNISPEDPEFGDVVKYTIHTVYKPLIVSREQLDLVVSRTTVIGYY